MQIISDFLFFLGCENDIDLLLKNGTEIDAEDQYKRTPLHSAAYKGKLWKKVSDITSLDKSDTTCAQMNFIFRFCFVLFC